LGRLRYITYLHDFDAMETHIAKERDYKSGDFIDMESLVSKAFFPKVSMDFSPKENPLRIVKTFDKFYSVMR
jgi:hypothetical protein